MTGMTVPIALTSGEPAGVGLELTLKAWQALRGETPFFLIADRRHVAALNPDIPVAEIDYPEAAVSVFPKALPLLHHAFALPNPPGQLRAANAAGVISAIERAVALVTAGKAAALCTNPINKQALKEGAGFAFPGHTEFLSHLAGGMRPVMMLAAPMLRVIPVTIHEPLARVPALLDAAVLEETIRITHHAMQRLYGLKTPRLAVAGLNPHAGEGGAMGREEITLIAPLLARMRAEGMHIAGPLPADTMFHAEARETYDVALCMYHDQALIPLKTLDFHGGINVTLGLPFLRTSPDHGTALDIAGKNRANPSSLINALRQAAQFARNRPRA